MKIDLHDVGCLGKITSFKESEDGRFLIELKGMIRFQIIKEIKSDKAYRQCEVNFNNYSDDLIEKRLNKSLQDIKDEKGYMYLREIEQEMVLTIDASIQIISTGGSVIYSEQAITHLKQISSVVFVDTPYELIKKRIGDASDRGFSVPDGFSVKEAFDERMPLYQKHQDFIVDGTNSADCIIKTIEKWI